MKIALLSGDLLANILHFDDVSHVVVTLWKCGDASLNSKMSDWVESVDLEDRNPASTSRYPKMLSNLRKLRRLRIHHQGHIAPPSILSQELRKLPSTLTNLEIASYCGHLPFYDFSATSDPFESFKCAGMDLKMWNIGDSFPHLAKLAIISTDEFFRTRDEVLVVSPLLRTLLPPHLEHLELSTRTEMTTTQMDACFPESLCTLILVSVPENSSSWPPHITHLEGDIRYLTKLPSSLTRMPHIQVDEDASDSLHHLTSLTNISLVSPANITSSIDWMPTTITEIRAFEWELSITAVRSLPPTLQHLTVRAIDWSTAPPITHGSGSEMLENLWPQSLRLVHVSRLFSGLNTYDSNSNELDAKIVIASLPQSLTNLELDFEEIEVAWDLRQLPHLQELSIFGNKLSLKKVDSEMSPNLQLKTLTTRIAKDLTSSFEALAAAPSITNLSVSGGWELPDVPTDSTIFFENLPKKLKRLDAWFLKLSFNPKAWPLLPQSLTELEMGTCRYDASNNDDDEEVAEEEEWKTWTDPADCLPFLPPGITDLALPPVRAPTAAILQRVPCLGNIRKRFSLFASDLKNFDSAALTEVMNLWPAADHIYNETQDSSGGYLNREEVIEAQKRAVTASRSFPHPSTIAKLSPEK